MSLYLFSSFLLQKIRQIGEISKYHQNNDIQSFNTVNTKVLTVITYLNRLRIVPKLTNISLKSIYILLYLLLVGLAGGLTLREVANKILYAFLLSTSTAVSCWTQHNVKDFLSQQ